MKILLTLFVLFFSKTLLSESFDYYCLNNKSNFQQVFEIDIKNKTLKHLFSYSFDTKAKYEVYEYKKVIHSSKDLMVYYTFKPNSMEGLVGFSSIDFKNNQLIRSSHYLGGTNSSAKQNNLDEYFYLQLYNCYKG